MPFTPQYQIWLFSINFSTVTAIDHKQNKDIFQHLITVKTTADFMDSTSEHIALSYLNILRTLLSKSVATVNHSNCEFKCHANKRYKKI